jgi:arginyl-tRNA synthetase
MPDPLLAIRPRLQQAVAAVLGPEHVDADPVLRRSDRPGVDYQANAAMALAKRAGRNPRELADAIVTAAVLDDLVEHVEVAGPGFINLTLRNEFLASEVETTAADERLGVSADSEPETVVVDYSGPNLAKEMHVGHLRSTIIGDALVRILGFLGHRVIRQNHMGDWGTQFGMLVQHLADTGIEAASTSLSDLNAFYQEASARFRSEPDFAERARARVVALQAGDPETLRVWQALVDESHRHANAVYERLDVVLGDDDIRPESFYNPMLDEVAAELEKKGLAVVDDGALCVFPPGFTGRENEPLPLIVRKSDGGYGYQATDLAALRFRTRDLAGTRLVYVVGSPQQQHLSMIFAVGEMAGWLTGPARAEHVAFGSILGPDGKMFKTRSGENVKLNELLDEAVDRAAAAVAEKNPELDAAERAQVAHAIGIGAVKYADLGNDRVKDYVFDFDRMLSFEGHTAPYLQYAHARIKSIFRRVEGASAAGPVRIEHAAERELGLQLLAFDESVQQAAEHLQPHRLATYLFELAQAFTDFYESCPVLRADTDEQRASRLALADLTARTLAKGLDLLGIAAPERM